MAVSGFISSLDPTVEEISDIKTAVSEAVTNSIVHGYQNEIGNIYIQVLVGENRTVQIRIRDKGCGIPDIKKAMEPMFTTAAESERSGLGFSMMECSMDKVRVVSKIGKGTTVSMMKKLSDR